MKFALVQIWGDPNWAKFGSVWIAPIRTNPVWRSWIISESFGSSKMIWRTPFCTLHWWASLREAFLEGAGMLCDGSKPVTSCRSDVMTSEASCGDTMLLGQTLWFKSPSNYKVCPKSRTSPCNISDMIILFLHDVIAAGPLLCHTFVWGAGLSMPDSWPALGVPYFPGDRRDFGDKGTQKPMLPL